ncbi:FAD-dependent monooxygenase [Bartonella sp. HY761]|uniref:FAD-dependent monooxygenase n=1 Tax=Bartonella sp. HY761 TaxID=2979330 RepID=UPI0021FE9FD3|nr:FAD-dependent monooxygenase [Bartonella sp. HY761]UXN07261.1 FAD-dependent monooxygenase [Bartonella sp. HY761]
MSDKAKIIISGAGVAGMASALALAKNGYKIAIYEKVAKLAEVGAGLQLAPNATRLLRDFDILDDIQKSGVEPDTIMMRDGRKDDLLSMLPVKEVSLNRWKAPYVTIHRANLQKILYDALLKNPLIDIYLDHEIVDYSGSLDQGYNVTLKQGETTTTVNGDLLVISDGVWSQLRQKHLKEKSQFSGYISWRATLPFDQVPADFMAANKKPTIGVYMHGDGHFITYPARPNEVYNFVAITAGENPGESWSKTGDKAKLLNHFSNWHKNIKDIMQQADDWTYWPLFKMPSLRFRGLNNEIFVGDSSHAVTPFAAQGAAMAIEDAATLASALLKHKDFESAITTYETARNERLTKVAKRGDFNRFVYHASGPIALARNLFMKMRPQEKFLTDLDWLYNFDARDI